MKTGIEQNEVLRMAREAGLHKQDETFYANKENLERFSAIVREDERESNGFLGEQLQAAVDNAYKSGQRDEREKIAVAHKIRPRGKSVYHEFLAEREKQQEPVAWYGLVMEAASQLELASYAITQDSESKRCALSAAEWVREQAKQMRSTTQPTAALAARQMRDAAVKVCQQTHKSLHDCNHRSEAAGVFLIEKAIAALPIPGEEK